MNANLLVSALFVGPLAGVIVALAVHWPARSVLVSAIMGEAIAYVVVQQLARHAANRAMSGVAASGQGLLATAAVVDTRVRVAGLVALLVLALPIAGLGLLARRLIGGPT